MSHIFISYVREDQELVDKLVSDLEAKGALIWLDRDDINPGQLWQDAIRDAIEQGNFFVACFSNNSVNKQKSGMNEELLIAVDELRKKQYGAIWFIPVLLNYCTVPRIPIGLGMTLNNFQWVSLADDWEDGVTRIANITLDLEKKKFREEIDMKANAVIDAERKLLHQEYLGHNWNAICVYIERVSVARRNCDNFAKNYANRFGEEYQPITDLYKVFENEKRLSESKLKKGIDEVIDHQFRFMILWLCFVVFLVVFLTPIGFIIPRLIEEPGEISCIFRLGGFCCAHDSVWLPQ